MSSSSTDWYTPVQEIKPIVENLRSHFQTHATKSKEWRQQQLQQVVLMFKHHGKEFEQAMHDDMKQTAMVKTTEIQSCIFDAEQAISKLSEWMKDEEQPNSFLMTYPGTAKIVKDPQGVVSIIGPWNYPISLIIRPAIGAIAAGNCIVLKPSEVASNCAKVLTKYVREYLDNSAIAVVNGGVAETTELLDQKFDYIFYTGNSTVGRIVMQKAAVHLTPVTLELGGKSPLYIDGTFDWDVGISRIVWGKFLNCGQTCVAPDYILLDKKVDPKEFAAKLTAKIDSFFVQTSTDKSDIKNCVHYGRIINENHTKRLAATIQEQKDKGAEILYGGEVDVDDHYVQPTIVLNPALDTKLMTEETFGPILPILPIEDHNAAIDFINARDNPLALYIYSSNEKVQNDIIRRTSSGGVGVNDCVVHIISPFIPFGGKGASGMGKYNGKWSFDTFTHEKSVLIKTASMDLDIRYPPFTTGKMDLIRRAYSLLNSIRGIFGAATTMGSYLWGAGNKDSGSPSN